MYARFANSDHFPVTIRSPMLERVYIREGGYVGARLPDQDEAMFLGEGYVDDDGLVVAWLSSDSIPRNMHRAGLSKPAWGQREIEEWAARHGATAAAHPSSADDRDH